MFKEFDIALTQKCVDYYKGLLSKAELIVEYGSGGSTLLAASEGKTVLTVETDAHWLLELMGSYKEQSLKGDIIPLLAKVGETGKWGYPSDKTKMNQWLAYTKIPWIYCKEHALNPDIVLIDGRFRVASFLSSCVYVKKETTILFDDYVNRKQYHVFDDIVKPCEIIDNRMAVYQIKPGLVSAEYLLENISYYLTAE